VSRGHGETKKKRNGFRQSGGDGHRFTGVAVADALYSDVAIRHQVPAGFRLLLMGSATLDRDG